MSELEGAVLYVMSGLQRGVVPPSMSGVIDFSSLSRPDRESAISVMSRIDGVRALPAMPGLEGGVSESVNAGLEAGGMGCLLSMSGLEGGVTL